MKKILATIALAVLTASTYSQSIPPHIQAVVDAENNFAALSKKENTKAAFLANLGDYGVVMNEGEPVNGFQQWRPRPVGKSLLFWWPVFADASASGDFGYTTGPYEWSADRNNPVPQGFGYYSSVWKKNAKGVWKVAIDMGIAFPAKEEVNHNLRAAAANPENKLKGKVSKERFLDVDKKHVVLLNETGKSFDLTTLADEARVHRTGHWPYTTRQAIEAIDESGKRFSFEQVGGDVSSAGDMAYAYGKVKIASIEDGKPQEDKLNYLRVWKREGRDWKIVLDVIGG